MGVPLNYVLTHCELSAFNLTECHLVYVVHCISHLTTSYFAFFPQGENERKKFNDIEHVYLSAKDKANMIQGRMLLSTVTWKDYLLNMFTIQSVF